ncbi:GIP [Symbiodinium necroappetens]|uniref:GIP protein n=1 Tax=Symbiodinium necroappetens TaxID=1628268 RepID=A0A812QYM4_9DINO|nr:GIP [Symbiodinium necroappetens]
MAEWTARPTAMTSRPPNPSGVRDDSSSASLSHEQIMEEVKKQVQLAMTGRDMEVKDLRSENQELKQALEAVAKGRNLREVMGGIQATNLEANFLAEVKAPRNHKRHLLFFEAALGYLRAIFLRKIGLMMQPVWRVDFQIACLVKEAILLERSPVDQPWRRNLDLWKIDERERQLQQVYMDKKGGVDHETLKSTELPALPELSGETGVEFSDWLYVAEQTIGAMSDSASSWYEKTLACVREAYARYQVASPLERLTIGPRPAPELLEPKWVRLDRKVMTLILAAMPKMVREDAVAHRVSSVAAVLFRLHILYSPGGIAERTAVLKHLEGQSAGDQVVDAIAALRKWKRHLTRSQEMHLSVPDGSILLRGLEVTVAACVQKHPEMSFRLSLARNELQLQNRPTQESVMKFYDHLMAELQQALPAKWSLKSFYDYESHNVTHEGRRQEAPRQHSFFVLYYNLETNPYCGSGTTGGTEGNHSGNLDAGVVIAEPVQAVPEGGVQGPEIQAFMKEVNTMLQRLTRLNRMELVDALEPDMKRVEASMASFGNAQDGVALLDSGATHPFKPLVERDLADIVQVQLADGQKVDLQQNRAGTLMPVKDSHLDRANSVTTIVPLGTLVQELGCTVAWDKRGLRVRHPEHGELTTHVVGSCPFIGEARALQLIEEIEARKLEQLKVNTVETQLRVLGLETEASFETSLLEYRRTGNRTEGLKALMASDSTFYHLTESQRCALAQDIDLSDEAGVRYLKQLPIKRSMRKHLLTSSWIVNLFSGEGQHSDLKALEENGLVLLEMDLKKSRAFNLKGPTPAHRALLWAAMRGQIEGLLGSPPRGEGEGELVLKQFFLWWVSKMAAEEVEARIPYFAMTMPVNSALWLSPMWKQMKGLQAKLRWTSSGMTRCVTNLATTWPEEDWEVKGLKGQLRWTVGFRQGLVQGIKRWRNTLALCRMDGPLSQMTKEELNKWTQHVRQGHQPYNKRCQTCISSKATGHAHRRVHAPSCFTLSVDVCGPFRVKGQTPSALDHRYMLVGSYTMPVLKREVCEPGDVIVNEPEGGVGEIEIGPREVGTEPADDPGPSGPIEVGTEPADDPGPVHGDAALASDLEGVFEVEGEDPTPVVGAQDQEEMDRLNAQYNELVKEVGDRLDYQVLRYAVPMRSRRASEVNARVRQMYLQVKADGLEVFRLHSDRATELCNRRLREWLLERGVLATTGEAQTPQQNGRAEATVKFVKLEAKRLMTSAGLPKQTWPLAMMYAAAKQRHRVLGRTDDMPCFGTPVHVRTKVYGQAGRYDLENKWSQGIYVGPSSEVQHAHVVRFPDSTFVTSLHLKQNLVDADSLIDLVPREIEIALPEQVECVAKNFIAKEKWAVEDVLELYSRLKAIKSGPASGRSALSKGKAWFTGMFVHGGVAGLRSATTRLKWTTRYLVQAAKKITGHPDFTALGILEDMSIGCHKDSHNEVGSENVVVLLKAPGCGGDLWLEHDDLDDKYADWRKVSKKLWKKGFTHKLEVGQPFKFQPRRWHEVQEWSGARVVMVLYTPRLSKLHYQDRDALEFVGFQSEFFDVIHNNEAQTGDHVIHNNEEQLKDYFEQGKRPPGDQCELHLVRKLSSPEDETLEDAVVTLTESQDQLLEDLQERSERLRFMLEEEEILAEECRRAGQQVEDEVDHVRAYLEDMMDDVTRLKAAGAKATNEACLRAISFQEEPDYEKLLQELDGDLEVVHTVPLQQVRAALDLWMEALKKEVKQLLDGTLKPMPISKARELEKRGLLKLVPSKGVYTLKPPQVKGNKVRRKFRLVLCGNHVGRDDDTFSLYASGVSADTVRLALAYASHRKWYGGTSDVTGAFLLAQWPDHLARYGIFPPRILIEAGLADPNEIWEVMRPLYGLRESPAIWAKCRTDRLKEAKISYKGRTIVLKQSTADPEIWLAYDEKDVVKSQGSLLALIITYVDDLFYLSDKPIIEAIHSWVQEAWPCSELEWADGCGGTRYLGMEIQQQPDFTFELSQEGYIRELLRSYGMEEALSTRLPCPKEWLADGEDSEEENFSMEELKLGQKAVGEQLWLMMRCRPDLQFPVAYMASKVSKKPNKVVQIAKRLLAYLKTTVMMKMVIGGESTTSDPPSSSEPQQITTSSNPNHHYSEHDINNIPSLVGWSDASFSPSGEKSFGASVITVNGYPVAWKVPRKLLVDNASAVAMITGGPGSWRTRHLKVRSAKIREQVESAALTVEHVGGDGQLADLATKMHGKIRLWELLALWNFRGLPEEAMQALQMKTLYLTCLIWAMLVQPSTAADATSAKIQVAGIDELFVVTLLVCITAVVMWEVGKGAMAWVLKACRESPKQRRLRKLREAAKGAAEEEVDRAVLARADDATPPPPPHPVMRSTRSPARQEPTFTTGANFEVMAHDAFYKTDSARSKLHTNPQCHGLRNAGQVYKLEYEE